MQHVFTKAQQSNYTVGPEKCNIAKEQDKDLKTAFMDMLEVLKEDMNKFTNEIYENTNSGMK